MDGHSKVYLLALTAIMAAITCVVGPVAIPVGPVPLSLTTLAIYFSLYLLGGRRGVGSCLVYVLLGLVGMPVFSGFTGGLGKVLGPTGGYILGYLPMALLAGAALDRRPHPLLQALALAGSTAVCYALGTAWFCLQMDTAPEAALAACVLPFLPFDLGKIALAVLTGPALRNRLEQAGALTSL